MSEQNKQGAVAQNVSAGRIPRTVWVLGFVSLLMDVSSEMIHALLPLFMAGTLGASAVWIGVTEGVGEATALLSKVFSGVIADRFGHRKALVFAGYAMGVLSKPLFAAAGCMPVVFGARFFDRLGKGLRGAPRDAIVADVTPRPLLGAAYGLRQSLDAAGAFIGPLLATVLLYFYTEDFRTIFWLALIPGALCLLLILLGVEEKAANGGEEKPVRAAPAPWRDFFRFESPAFRSLVGIGVVFSLARFSNAFIVLRAADAGIAVALIPMMMVGMNFVYSLSSYPFGRIADKLSPVTLLALGFVLLTAADLVLGFGTGSWSVLAGAVLWGLHLGATQGLFAMLIAKSAPADKKATAFGVYNFFTGIATGIAGLLAGILWAAFGATASFAAGAFFAVCALIWLMLSRRVRDLVHV